MPGALDVGRASDVVEAPFPDSPPTARWELVAGLIADRDAVRHASDGGGRAWLQDDEAVTAGSLASFQIVYEAGELGVAVGGAVTLQTSPFWGWSPAWADGRNELPAEWRDTRPGFTEVSVSAPGVELLVETFADGLVVAQVQGRALVAGDRLQFRYGAGKAQARVDRFAESGSPLLLAVDGDGDGVRELLAEPPGVEVVAGASAQLVATVTSVVAPDEPARLTLAVLDALGNAGTGFVGSVHLSERPESSDLPQTLELTAEHLGVISIEFRCATEGVHRIGAETDGGLFARSNPMVVRAGAEPVLWGDLHGHSLLSDGTGTPDSFYDYARRVAALDVAALTDHDHWGFRFVDGHPELWDQIRQAAESHHAPGQFVTLLGYEWTSWIHGHRHVLSFDEAPSLQVLSSLDDRYQTPRQLWDALAGQPVLTFAHHSAGGPIATDWSFPPDPVLEPVTEVVSVHGSSESLDGPGVIYRPLPGNFVRDVLSTGVRLGFLGSGDGHDGHPGLAHLSNPSGTGGLVALLTGLRTRPGVLAALRARACYATSGARMLVRLSLDGAPMGGVVTAGPGDRSCVVVVRGTAPLAAVELVRGPQIVDRVIPEDGTLDLIHAFPLRDLVAGEFVYLRVIQLDGHAAYTSPVFVE